MSDQLNALREQAEEVAQCYDAFMPDLGLGGMLRDLFRNVLAALAPPGCDCDLNPHHRWNCALTPIWAQTIRDLDCNPWAVVVAGPPVSLKFRPFVWIGSLGTHCGRGPCCLGDGHDGRCRM